MTYRASVISSLLLATLFTTAPGFLASARDNYPQATFDSSESKSTVAPVLVERQNGPLTTNKQKTSNVLADTSPLAMGDMTPSP